MMKKKHFETIYIFIIVMIVLLFACSFLATADEEFYVNDGTARLPKEFEGVFAIGKSGTQALFSGDVYALTGSGMQALGAAVSRGGGGLLYEDGTVPIQNSRVKVGLNYSFSASRDSSVASSVLKNAGGGGFSIGCYDEEGVFECLAETEQSELKVLPGPDSGVDVYVSGEESPLFSLEATSRDNYLVVRAEPVSEKPLIDCGGIAYPGEFAYAVLANDRLTVVNIADLEDYVMGVCAIEMSESWPLEALKAQAVAARTFVQRMIGTSVYYYSCGFDVTADTYTQAYRGTRGVGDTIRTAVEATRNQYLTKEETLIEALYSAADGGATEDAQNVFGFPNDYLRGVLDPFEASAENENPYSEWRVVMTPAQVGARLGIGSVKSITATTSDTGNVVKLEFVSEAGETATLIRDNCRTRLGLKNIRYEISRETNGNFVFTGSGFGHNLGMSQWGAYAMAKYYEKDYRFILGFYYTGVGLSSGELPPVEDDAEPEAEEESAENGEEPLPGETETQSDPGAEEALPEAEGEEE